MFRKRAGYDVAAAGARAMGQVFRIGPVLRLMVDQLGHDRYTACLTSLPPQRADRIYAVLTFAPQGRRCVLFRCR